MEEQVGEKAGELKQERNRRYKKRRYKKKICLKLNFLEIKKNTSSEIESTLDGVSSSLHIADEKISELEYIAIETI